MNVIDRHRTGTCYFGQQAYLDDFTPRRPREEPPTPPDADPTGQGEEYEGWDEDWATEERILATLPAEDGS